MRRVKGVNGAPDGRVSSYLHDQVKVGDLLEVSAPAGDFVLTPTESPLLLASAGAGITTVLPIVEHIARTQPQRTVIVAHADRRAQDHALREPCCISGERSTTSRPTPGTKPSTRATPAPAQGFMDLTDIAAPGRHPGLHLRSVAVHAARQVDAAGPWRAAGPNPLRGLRARPVGRPNPSCFGGLAPLLDLFRT